MKWSKVFDGMRRRSRWTAMENIRSAFRDYHDALHWLASLVVDDEKLASACIVDACLVAERQSQTFHEWLIYWAGIATVRCAIEKQHPRIAELTRSNAQHSEQADLERPTLSQNQWRAMIENSSLIRAHIDLLSRLVLVVRGIGGNSYRETAVELGTTTDAAKHAYAVAFDTLEFVSTPFSAPKEPQLLINDQSRHITDQFIFFLDTQRLP